MKKTFKLMLAFALVALSSASAWAAELVNSTQYDTDGYQYVIKSMAKVSGVWTGEVSVKKNTFSGAAINIKNTVDITVEGTVSGEPVSGKVEFKVVEVEANAFKGLTSATSITIGANVKKIDISAFEGCTNVTGITFATNTNTIDIENDAFKGVKTATLDLTPITGTLNAVNLWGIDKSSLTTVKFPKKVKSIVVNAFKDYENLETVVFAEATDAEHVKLTIGGGAFSGTAIKTLDLTNARIEGTAAGEGLNKLFEDNNVTLKKVIMSKHVQQLNDNALANCIQLSNVDFSNSTKLVTIGDGALSNTIVSEYDFTNCYTVTKNAAGKITAYATFLNFQKDVNPFVNGTTTTNKNLVTVKLPFEETTLKFSPVTVIGTTFANCEVLTTIEKFEVSKVTTIETNTAGTIDAFEYDKALTALEFPLTLATVTGEPFWGCEKLATLTFNNNNTVLTIGDGANNIYGTALDALTTLTVKVPAHTGATKNKASVTIATGALVGCTGITTLTIAEGEEFIGTINTFALNAETDATVTFGDIVGAASIATITGPLGTNTTALTIGDWNPTAAFATAIVDGNISAATVGAVKEASVLKAIGLAASIKFTGNITAALAQSPANSNLTTLDFGAVEMAANMIPATTFDETVTPNLTSLTWKPADTKATAAFNKNAFNTAGAPLGAAAYVTFHTTTAVGDGVYNLDEANLIAVKFDAEAAPIVPLTFEVYGTATSDYFYGKLTTGADQVAIDKLSEDGEQVDVYSAFVDSKDQKIYMDRLATKDGKFIVFKNQTVIIRLKNPVKTTDHAKIAGGKVAIVKGNTSTLWNTMRYKKTGSSSYDILNDLQLTDKIFSSDYIGTNYVGKTLFAMANPAKVGQLQFDPVAKTSYLPQGAVFVETDELPASAVLRVVFLDEPEDATAILNIMEARDGKSGNGKIYNMQGIEVDSSYKGFVIKNGKKIYQK